MQAQAGRRALTVRLRKSYFSSSTKRNRVFVGVGFPNPAPIDRDLSTAIGAGRPRPPINRDASTYDFASYLTFLFI